MRVLQPTKSLLHYYALSSLLAGPFFFIPLIPLYFRYHTLRYQIDDEGITTRWGILFRREISLTYARIQDIHLSSNLLERWLGIAKIQVQTASGSSSAEMMLEGLKDYEAIRDFLYSRMRGAHAGHRDSGAELLPGQSVDAPTGDLSAVLTEVAAELRAIRQSLPPVPSGPRDG
jgi:putative membrane protein